MRSGFTLIEVMVTLGVLASVLVVTNQVIVSAVRQVEVSQNSFYVDVILSEAFAHVDYIHQANLLRYGESQFEDCKLTRLDATLGVDCEGLDHYNDGRDVDGRYVLVMNEISGRQQWVLVARPGNVVDDLDDPVLLVDNFEDFEVYEFSLDEGGVVYTNVSGDVSGDDRYKPLGYYRYIDISHDGYFQIVVAYMDEFANLKVEKPDYVISLDE